jgi:hypothetical protein
MKRNFWLKQLPIVLIAAALVITATAWQGQPGKTKSIATDTIPNKKVKDIDEALQDLENGQQDLEHKLQGKNWDKEMNDALDKIHFDADKMKQQIDEAVKQIDAKKIQEQIQKAMQEVDLAKMKTELQQNLDKVELQDVKEEIAKAMKEIDAEKIKNDINVSIAKIDMDKIKMELDKVKDIDFKQMEENIKKMKPEIEKSLQNAKEGIEKAKKEMLEDKKFIDELSSDGLIDKNKNYKIEYKDGGLIINGKKQPADVVKKYSEFLKSKNDFTIKKNEEGFDINKD